MRVEMKVDELKEDLFNLIAYMITSARGLHDEPTDYGTFRLLDSAGRLLAIMESQGLLDPFLADLKRSVDEEREGNMDPERQSDRLDQLVLKLAEELLNRLD
jgi:hypothetical protein